MALGYDHDQDHHIPKAHQSTNVTMMRVAVAGTCGLARRIARSIINDTSHTVVLLSRSDQPDLTANGYRVTVINYSDPNNLLYALRGIDTVISTVTGPNQIRLIMAAIEARVRRFAPAEFEGPPSSRNPENALDRNRRQALQALSYLSNNIESTSFVCGILYERFQPGGLLQSGLRYLPGLNQEGNYIFHCRNRVSRIPTSDDADKPVTICITSSEDVAKFVTKALDLPRWPRELRMVGQRMTVTDLVTQAESIIGQPFRRQPVTLPALRVATQTAIARNDVALQYGLTALSNTIEGYYDFDVPTLNLQFPDVRPVDFRTWFQARWAPQG